MGPDSMRARCSFKTTWEMEVQLRTRPERGKGQPTVVRRFSRRDFNSIRILRTALRDSQDDVGLTNHELQAPKTCPMPGKHCETQPVDATLLCWFSNLVLIPAHL